MGIGPRIGIDVSRELGDGFSFFGPADASILFGMGLSCVCHSTTEYRRPLQ